MSNERIRQLLAELRNETEKTEVDAETLSALHRLDSEIHQLLDTEAESPDSDAVLERARNLEARFAVNHPAAERFMREVIDTLVKIGV